jgi:hypothetical protein
MLVWGMSCATQSQSHALHWTGASSLFAHFSLNIDLFCRIACTRNVNLCRGFLIDGDHAIEWRNFPKAQVISVSHWNWFVSLNDPHLLHFSQGTIPFMSIRLLSAWKKQANRHDWPIFHTAIDDLESYLWLLIWVIAHILKDKESNNPGIALMLEVWSGGLSTQSAKEEHAFSDWDDVVFGGLIEEWITMFRSARKDADKFSRNLTQLSFGSPDWVRACDELEKFSREIYDKVLQSGFKHLEVVRQFSDWDSVIEAN